MSVIETSLFLILVTMAVWSLQYATFTATMPLAFEGSGNNMEYGQNGFPYDPDLFEGDIIITPEQYKEYYDDGNLDDSDQPEHVS